MARCNKKRRIQESAWKTEESHETPMSEQLFPVGHVPKIVRVLSTTRPTLINTILTSVIRFPAGTVIVLFASILESNQAAQPGVKRTEREADHSAPPNTEV